jgi:hypothetical protein
VQELYLKKNYNNNVTVDHDHNVEGVSLIESWIVEDEKHDKSNLYNLKAVKGSWVVKMKVYNEEVWQQIKDGKFKGFSIEGKFDGLDQLQAESHEDMGVTIIDNTQTINNATWKVQPDVLASESGIVKENGTIHYIGGKLKYHADGSVLPLSGMTEYATQVLDYVNTVGTAATGNKYLMDVAAENPYTIAEYNGTTWVFTPLVTGQKIEVLATGKTYIYDSENVLSPLTEYGEQKALSKLTLSRKTDSYTLVYADQLKTIEMNKATANTLTVPANIFVAGNQILITQYGAGQTTITAGAGMTLRSDGGKLKINSQYSSATILFISATEAYVFGNLAL